MVGREVTIMIVTYVDGSWLQGRKRSVNRSLSRKLPMTDLGACTWYDGCAIFEDREKGVTTIFQRAFTESLVQKFDVKEISDLPASSSSSDDLKV